MNKIIEKKYREQQSENKRISGLNLQEIKNNEDNDDTIKKQNIALIKEKCKNLFELTYSSEEDKNYIDALNWCTETYS